MGKCCDYSAGKLRTPVTFERSTLSADGAGGYTRSWAAVTGAPTRAYVKQVSGRERYASERTEAISAVRVVVRYGATLREHDRVTIDGRVYNIERIDDVEFARKWIELTARGGVAV